MTRWELRRVSTSDTATAVRCFDTGWEPFAIHGEGRQREVWYRRPVTDPALGKPVFVDGLFAGVEAVAR